MAVHLPPTLSLRLVFCFQMAFHKFSWAWFSNCMSLPVLCLSMMFQDFLSFSDKEFGPTEGRK